jgi:ApeA N-terminal domain 1
VAQCAVSLLDRIPALLPELNLVTDEAVDCRNHFVHGSKSKLDYSDEFDQVIFFTEALEFVFAASDLIECGWDIGAWSKQSSSVSHPFDRLRVNYAARLTDLKRALAAAKAAAG